MKNSVAARRYYYDVIVEIVGQFFVSHHLCHIFFSLSCILTFLLVIFMRSTLHVRPVNDIWCFWTMIFLWTFLSPQWQVNFSPLHSVYVCIWTKECGTSHVILVDIHMNESGMCGVCGCVVQCIIIIIIIMIGFGRQSNSFCVYSQQNILISLLYYGAIPHIYSGWSAFCSILSSVVIRNPLVLDFFCSFFAFAWHFSTLEPQWNIDSLVMMVGFVFSLGIIFFSIAMIVIMAIILGRPGDRLYQEWISSASTCFSHQGCSSFFSWRSASNPNDWLSLKIIMCKYGHWL